MIVSLSASSEKRALKIAAQHPQQIQIVKKTTEYASSDKPKLVSIVIVFAPANLKDRIDFENIFNIKYELTIS